MGLSEDKVRIEARSLPKRIQEGDEALIERAGLSERMERPPEEFMKQFVSREIIFPRASVIPRTVQGTYHPEYQGLTWLEFLRRGKRMDLNLRLLAENPWYYLSVEPKVPTMYYVAWGERIFIGDDGNHRTAIARAFFAALGTPEAPLTQVHLVRYELAQPMLDVFGKLRDLSRCAGRPVMLTPMREMRERTDAVGERDAVANFYAVRVLVENGCGERLVIDEDSLPLIRRGIGLLSELTGLPRWKRLLRRIRMRAESEVERRLLRVFGY